MGESGSPRYFSLEFPAFQSYDGRMAWKQTSAGREPTDDRNKDICEALRAGDKYAKIAEDFEISITRVSQIREYAGIERRKRGRRPRTSLGSTPRRT